MNRGHPCWSTTLRITQVLPLDDQVFHFYCLQAEINRDSRDETFATSFPLPFLPDLNSTIQLIPILGDRLS